MGYLNIESLILLALVTLAALLALALVGLWLASRRD